MSNRKYNHEYRIDKQKAELQYINIQKVKLFWNLRLVVSFLVVHYVHAASVKTYCSIYLFSNFASFKA